jgi:radical SAM protein with 4Fe4S-binding SPASM domain
LRCEGVGGEVNRHRKPRNQFPPRGAEETMIHLDNRVILTERCNASCPHCFNRDMRGSAEMNADLLLEFMQTNARVFKENARLKLMGGEPTLHPRIREILIQGTKCYRLVNLFTNGTKIGQLLADPSIRSLHREGKIVFTVNGHTFRFKGFKEYVDLVHEVWLHNVIELDNLARVERRIRASLPYAEKIRYILSPGTDIDIFDSETLERYRMVWVDSLIRILPLLDVHHASVYYDHTFPLCFYTQEMLDRLVGVGGESARVSPMHDRRCCANVPMVGLIDCKFDLYFCNQTRIRLGSMLDENGALLPLSRIEEMVRDAPGIKIRAIEKLSPRCKRCPSLDLCKMGCWYNRAVRRRASGGHGCGFAPGS